MSVTFRPVETRRTFEEAIEQIAEGIALGDLEVGDRLPPERVLAAQMHISRPTVREALRTLADSGVIEILPGKGGGAYVRSDLVTLDSLRHSSEIRLSEVGGVLEARRVLEPRVAQLAGLHARAEDLETMQRVIDRQHEILGRSGSLDRYLDHYMQLEFNFHLAMARATGNSTIVSLVRSLQRRLAIVMDMAWHTPPIAEWGAEIHERTLAAIASRDMQRIDEVMDEHLAGVEETWRKESGQAVLRDVPDFLRPSRSV